MSDTAAEPQDDAVEQPVAAALPEPAAEEPVVVDDPVEVAAPVAEEPVELASDDPAAQPPAEPPTEDVPAVVAAEPDAVLAAAVELARAAAVEEAGEAVGEHLGVEVEPAVEGDLVVTHSFAAALPGYVGWRWAVTLARAPEQEQATVDEVVLLPGAGALLAPEWVPWSARVAPGDLGPGDLLPPPADDPRLVPSYEDVDAEPLPFDLHRDLGLGRPRVLSAEGRELAAERWSEGPAGPRAPIAKQAPGRCADCGFLVPVAGGLGRAFGVCANAVAPDDGRVVALLHGCGAHSETVTTAPHASTTELVVEHEELELVDVASLPADD
ncbi:MAG TPA: DUF3027 domain-containing protein [Mycobacteriales bacterium]|nr:DUF3027 domain-containing protein [Mycobacteriales bacterium]